MYDTNPHRHACTCWHTAVPRHDAHPHQRHDGIMDDRVDTLQHAVGKERTGHVAQHQTRRRAEATGVRGEHFGLDGQIVRPKILVLLALLRHKLQCLGRVVLLHRLLQRAREFIRIEGCLLEALQQVAGGSVQGGIGIGAQTFRRTFRRQVDGTHHRTHRVGDVGNVLQQFLLAIALRAFACLGGNLVLELVAALLEGPEHGGANLDTISRNKLLSSAFKGHLGGHERDKDANTVLFDVDLVRPPGQVSGGMGNEIRGLFKDQGNTVGESMYVESSRHVLAPNRHGSLNDKGVPFVDGGRFVGGGNHIRGEFFRDAEVQVVFPRRTQCIARRVGPLHLGQHLVKVHLHGLGQ
eukprot:m.43085 g.43085  ORF g.43085 m.43085 type:complete len:352 (-) comp6361_c0_seq1:1021-2076(-)